MRSSKSDKKKCLNAAILARACNACRCCSTTIDQTIFAKPITLPLLLLSLQASAFLRGILLPIHYDIT